MRNEPNDYGCDLPDDLHPRVIWEDDGIPDWDTVEEDRESAIHRDDARFYEEDS